MEYHPAVKKGEVLTHAKAWMGLENTVLNKRNRHKRPYSVWSYEHETSKLGKSVETKGRLVVAWGLGLEYRK